VESLEICHEGLTRVAGGEAGTAVTV